MHMYRNNSLKQLRIALFGLFFLGLSFSSWSQTKSYKIGCLAFYNFENLFDLEDDPEIRDEDFTPAGKLNWTAEKYEEKMSHLSDILFELGTSVNPDGPAIIGACEIENRKVLEDLVQQEKLKERDYQIIHFDSPDKRGIDVAMLYQAKYFSPTKSQTVPFDLVKPNGDTVFTRDILMVEGLFDGEQMTILVNHWPSRSGGLILMQRWSSWVI